ncbi:hypothetical protein CgunFtcFv8_012944 [Champsocephalus gunnari]|uniref:C2 domain-containing protein n=1 Tax=Champsocephalus gunnari TaxID=52237 RepID=A0AAN8HT71_CHAGU|nr:hypothetical protein CgunFtcFv8_012944 [Champsocephalus gunnari]
MPYHDEEHPGQPLWQSVLLFCCKGMIEGIMVILFFWLLVQVLFTKQLEVHLQILLLVGLIAFCLSLCLGCVLCWRSHMSEVKDKDAMTSVPAPAEPLTFVQSPPPSLPRQQYEELDGDIVEYPSTFTSPAPSVSELSSLPFSKPARAASEQTHQPKSYFSLRRLNTTPQTAPLHKAIDPSHASLPAFPKLGQLSKKYQQTLAVTVLCLTGTPHRLQDVSVLGSLPPLYPCPIQASAQSSLSPETHSLVLLLKVSSVKELMRCVLRIAIYTREAPSMRRTTLAELEAECGGRDWGSEQQFHFTKELDLNKWRTKKSLISHDASPCKVLGCPPQIYILLQYQTTDHRIKATVLRAEHIENLVHSLAAAEYQVVINLHNKGVMISSRETEGSSCALWDSSFLLDLPPGEITQLPLLLEFVIMQVLPEGKAVGRVLIGAEAAGAGLAHWRDMCSLQVEQARWHIVQPECL